jgi:hypothetical protein
MYMYYCKAQIINIIMMEGLLCFISLRGYTYYAFHVNVKEFPPKSMHFVSSNWEGWFHLTVRLKFLCIFLSLCAMTVDEARMRCPQNIVVKKRLKFSEVLATILGKVLIAGC